MRTQTQRRLPAPTETAPDRKSPVPRASAKAWEHRYERRKLREQLRHLDWALVGAE